MRKNEEFSSDEDASKAEHEEKTQKILGKVEIEKRNNTCTSVLGFMVRKS